MDILNEYEFEFLDGTVINGIQAGTKLYLVNTSGNIQKSKVAAKDGDEWYFYVKDREVRLYANNKDLKSDTYKDWTDIPGTQDAKN